MSLKVMTPDPKALLAAIRRDIADGVVSTWKQNEAGYFTHVTPSLQWTNKALAPANVWRRLPEVLHCSPQRGQHL